MNQIASTPSFQKAKHLHDLRDWLLQTEAAGELLTIKQPVDTDQEMSGICYLLTRHSGGPALLFETPTGSSNSCGAQLLWNALGASQKRLAITLGEPIGLSLLDLIRRTKEKLKRPIAPVEIIASAAPVYEHSKYGTDIDLTQLPIPKHWPRDGGRYAGTGDAVITRDPETGCLNVGTYRMMVQGPRHVSLYVSPGKDAALHLQKARSAGQPLSVAAAWGVDPLLMIVGSQSFPRNASEYDYAGGLSGAPLPVVRGCVTDLLLPANAEIIIEGIIHPNAIVAEGPFGEFSGYYGKPEGDCPLVEVTALHHRTRPVLTNALMADYPSGEHGVFYSVGRSAKIWDDFDKLGVAGITGVYCHPAAAVFGMTIISIDQKYPGHAAQALALAAQMPGGAYFTKWLVAVDSDVDPTDINQVLWAMATRCHPGEDIDVLRNTWSSQLDPTQNPPEKRPYGSKALVNACKDYRFLNNFAVRTAINRDVYDRLASRWIELGLPGDCPRLNSFD